MPPLDSSPPFTPSPLSHSHTLPHHPQTSRERLHGHNYAVSLSLRCAAAGADGYVVDFGALKAGVRALCGTLHERFLLPSANPHMTVVNAGGQVTLTLAASGAAGGVFSFPEGDVVALPLPNISVEGLAAHLAGALLRGPLAAPLAAAGVTSITLGVAESPGQEARYAVRL